MAAKYIIMRGAHFHYVRRVPFDLLAYFPTPVISRSLHTSDKKYATILGAAWEYRTHQLFLQLRSSMLDPHLVEHLITRYLKAGLDHLDAKAFGRDYKPGVIRTGLDVIPTKLKLPLNCFAEDSDRFAEQARKAISAGDIGLGEMIVKEELAPLAEKEFGVRLNKATRHELAVKALQAERQLAQVESAVLEGRLEILDLLRDKISNARPYMDLATLISNYRDHYVRDKGRLGERAEKQLNVDLEVIYEIFGNVSIDVVNSPDGIKICKVVLLKYPLNRVQRFDKPTGSLARGEKPKKRSIHDIIKKERGYDVIKPQTANAYIKRLKAIIDYAIKYEDYEKTNKWCKELFPVKDDDVSEREPYDQDDIKRLIDAICEKDLYRYKKEPKPERFWLVLIALMQGFRLSNITGLNKRDIFQHKGFWVFKLRFGKTKPTQKIYPVNDCLILLGFLEWVLKLDRENLFQDSSRQASTWYNRNDKDKNGNITWQGFEHYITDDPQKCLYSLRHNYGGEVYEVTDDIKATAEAMGHAPVAGKITNRYIGNARIKARKALLDKLEFNIDLNKLENRVKELFGILPPTDQEEEQLEGD